MVIDCITRAINWSASYVKAVRGIAGALTVIKRIFGRTYSFNRELGANKCNNTTSMAFP